MRLKSKIERMRAGDGDALGDTLMEALESQLLGRRRERPAEPEGEEIEERAPRLAKPDWVVNGKTVKGEKAAIAAAAAESVRSDGAAVKIWEKPDKIAGITGGSGYSVSVKRISRASRNF